MYPQTLQSMQRIMLMTAFVILGIFASELHAQQSIRLTSPNGGESLQAGSTQTITWTSSGTSGRVMVELSTNGGATWDLVFPNLVDDGIKENWTVPNAPSNNCFLRITDTDGSPTDRSDRAFTILAGTSFINVTDPSAGASWGMGTRRTIRWQSQNTGNSGMRIELYLNGNFLRQIANNVTGGNYSWQIPTDLTPSDTYQIRVSSTTTSDFDFSDFFTLFSTPPPPPPPAEITVTSPAAGESWGMGTRRTIRWSPSENSGSEVQIRLYRGGAFEREIIDTTPNTGNYSWLIPTDLPEASDYQVRVTSTSTSADDFSDNFTLFSTPPPPAEISVTSPNGGEVWQVGSTQNITWTSRGTSGRVMVELSINGGASWTTIFPNLVDDGTKENWEIPNTPSNNCLLRITDTDGSPSDQSDALFTIRGDGPQISPVVASPQIIGTEFWVDISVRDVQNLFGLSFQLDFTHTEFIDVVSPHNSNVVPGPFLGNDLLFFPNVDEAAGNVSIGSSRRGGQGGVSGSGVVARIRFISLPSTPADTEVLFSLSNVVANDPTGNPVALTPLNVTVTLTHEHECIVWPGDTNNDGIVDQADVLPIGICWQQTGPARPNASASWIGQPATCWPRVECTYADANGDGVVDQGDILPIGLNWNRTHSLLSLREATSLPKANTLGAASLQFKIDGAANPGEDFWVEIYANDVSNLFGISFEVDYSPTYFIAPLSQETGTWIGDDIVFLSDTTTTGKISIGISRKAGQGGVIGSGMVARIMLRMSASAVVGQDTTWLSLGNVQANDPNGLAMQLDVSNVTLVPLVTDVQTATASVPTAFSLRPNYPNPFNPSTTISYDLPERADVTLEIFDMLGRHVRTLIKTAEQPGYHSVTWDGRDEQGRVIASGVYIYRLRAGNFTQSRKMLLLQ